MGAIAIGDLIKTTLGPKGMVSVCVCGCGCVGVCWVCVCVCVCVGVHACMKRRGYNHDLSMLVRVTF